MLSIQEVEVLNILCLVVLLNYLCCKLHEVEVMYVVLCYFVKEMTG